MTSSLHKIAPRRTHRERPQPAARSKLGLLQKHKDYVLRARDFHSKEDRIKKMRGKARMKNPDEFYYAMEHTALKDGIHTDQHTTTYSEDFLRLLKTQDKNYVATQRNINAKKIEKLKAELPLIGIKPKTALPSTESDDDERGNIDLEQSSGVGRYTVFVDTKEEADQFKAETYFDTPTQFLGRRFNRPTRAMLAKCNLPNVQLDIDPMSIKVSERERAVKVTELASRLEREDQLAAVEQEMVIQKALMGKGRRRKVGNSYKWRADRKR